MSTFTEFDSINAQLELLKSSTILNNVEYVRTTNILADTKLHAIPLTASLNNDYTSASGDRYVSYFLIKGDYENLKGWGVTDDSIPQHIGSFKGRPFTITSNKFFPNSPYGEIYDHPVTDHFRKLGIQRPRERNDMIQQSVFQEEFRVGNIEDVFSDKDNNWLALIKVKPQFASYQMPPLVSPAIFQLNRNEPANRITQWLGMHLTGLDESPAYGNIALFKGSCDGTKNECLRKLSASMSRFDKMVTPCQMKRLDKLIASNQTELNLMKFRTAFDESDHPRDSDGQFTSEGSQEKTKPGTFGKGKAPAKGPSNLNNDLVKQQKAFERALESSQGTFNPEFFRKEAVKHANRIKKATGEFPKGFDKVKTKPNQTNDALRMLTSDPAKSGGIRTNGKSDEELISKLQSRGFGKKESINAVREFRKQ